MFYLENFPTYPHIFCALDTFIEIRRAVTWLATESGWARSKRSTICSGKLCGGIVIFGQCCPCVISQLPDKFNGHFATPLEYVISLIRWSLGCVRLLNRIYLTLTTLYHLKIPLLQFPAFRVITLGPFHCA